MAFHRAILVLLFLSFLAFQSSEAVEYDRSIAQICYSTPDPNFCRSSFRSDPRSAGSNLHTLAQVAIDLAKSLTISASSLIKDLDQKATDPNIKSVYKACLVNYNTASKDLNEIASDLKSRDYLSLNILSYALVNEALTCDGNFNEFDVPEPGELKASAKKVQTLYSAILDISKWLD